MKAIWRFIKSLNNFRKQMFCSDPAHKHNHTYKEQ